MSLSPSTLPGPTSLACSRLNDESLLYLLVNIICCSWAPDVQEIEGVNNIIQSVCRRAPGIRLPLLDARVSVRKCVGLGSRATKDLKFSAIADKLATLVDEAVDHADGVDDVLSNLQRWKPALPAKPQMQALALPLSESPGAKFDRSALKNAAHNGRHLLNLWKTHVEADERYRRSIVHIRGRTDAWLICTTYSLTATMKMLRATLDAEGRCLSVSLAEPPVVRSSLGVFAELDEFRRQGNNMIADVLPVDHNLSLGVGSSLAADVMLALEDAPARVRKSGSGQRKPLLAIADGEDVDVKDGNDDDGEESLAQALAEAEGNPDLDLDDNLASDVNEAQIADHELKKSVAARKRVDANVQKRIDRCGKALAGHGNSENEADDDDFHIQEKMHDLVLNVELEENEEGDDAMPVANHISDEALDLWMERYILSVSVLEEAMEAKQTPPLGVNVSLVCFPWREAGHDGHKVCFWNWVDAKSMYGHLVRDTRVTDGLRSRELIAAMSGIRPAERTRRVQGLEIIHPDCGVRMRRIRQQDGRPRVPQHIVHLKEMCVLAGQLAGADNNDGENEQGDELDPCALCGSRGDADVDAAPDDLGNLRKCPMCLTVAHNKCFEALLAKGKRLRLEWPQWPFDRRSLPTVFRGARLCACCTFVSASGA